MHLFFSTPIWVSNIDNHQEINTELEKFIYIEKNKDPHGSIKSNVKGWHSKQFDLHNKSKIFNFNKAKNRRRNFGYGLGYPKSNS